LYCQNCGARNDDNCRFCAECGVQINFTESTNNSALIDNNYNSSYNQPIKQSTGVATVGLVLAVLSIIICCAWPIFGTPAMICGIISLKRNEPETGKAWFAIIVGIIGLILTVIGFSQN